MYEIRLTPEKLKEAIDLGTLINSGLYSRVFTYGDRLIKLDQNLYDLLKNEDIALSKLAIIERYKSSKSDFNNREQLEELSKKQQSIRPRVPEGIIIIESSNSEIDGIIPGIILHPFINYIQLKHATLEYKQLLFILKRVFNDIKELANNKIAHEDIHSENILIYGTDVQIIDMSGPKIKVGKDFIDPSIMYECFAQMINLYNSSFGFEKMYVNEIITEGKISKMLTEFETNIRNK